MALNIGPSDFAFSSPVAKPLVTLRATKHVRTAKAVLSRRFELGDVFMDLSIARQDGKSCALIQDALTAHLKSAV
jgi:hypothetical protein